MRFGFYYNDLDSPLATFQFNQWNHVAYTYDRSTGKRFIYYNGIQVAAGTSSSDYIGNASLNIGKWVIGGQEWPGNIDDVKIYNYARTPDQIIEDMNAGHPMGGSPQDSAVVHYKLDEGSDNMCKGGSNDVCNAGNLRKMCDGNDLMEL